ncbi:MAG: 4Fe-4S dicluster domain-containing protein [Bryobacterales bacterium]|nr:4Fe-4S dicluster domain-containing protein [Bryobacterales bacterium]
MLSEQLRACGVVGAGGAGFPAHVKAQSKVEYVIANGAECEPLIHKDVELMKRYPREILEGLALMAQATGATKQVMGVKKKNAEAMEALTGVRQGAPWEFVKLGDFYPSGDEYELVYHATGRLIPPAGIPLQVGCVVNNVETLYNVSMAAQGVPVTRKFLTVCGAVRSPKTFWAPLGISYRELLEAAGGVTLDDFVVFVSGLMMGTLCLDTNEVVTKTTGGLIVLPRDHYLVTRRTRTQPEMNHIGKSACDQCSYCTELCPRYLLGYEVMPHKVMRGLGFTTTGAQHWDQWAELCCSCGLCTLYACPEDLYPKEACDQAKVERRAAGLRFVQEAPVQVHPMKEYRGVPLSQLRQRLRVEEYEVPTPFEDLSLEPNRVRVAWKQHAGEPAQPVVAEGQKVRAGDLLGEPPADKLGARVHASIDGTVQSISEAGAVIVAG